MAEMSTGSKVALGVGITLALAGMGVGLYFALRKKEEPLSLQSLTPVQRQTFQQLQKQNPQLSNTDLLKQLAEILKKSSKPSVSSGSSSGSSGSQQTQQKPKPQQKPEQQYGSSSTGYDYSANQYTYSQQRDEVAYNTAQYNLGSYADYSGLPVYQSYGAGGYAGGGSGSYGYAGGGSGYGGYIS